MSDDSQNPTSEYADMDPDAVAAFNTWHTFNDDLVKLGEFVTWLSDADNQASLVTFFLMDKDNLQKYQDGLKYQRDFLSGLEQMLEATQQTITEVMARQSS